MAKFIRYDSIENSYREKILASIQDEGLSNPDVMWVVQEKVHGANFSVYCYADGSVRFASRNNFKNGENELKGFYGVWEKVSELEEKARNAFEIASKTFSSPECVIVYGELIGGVYEHPDVPRNNKISRVQQGVHYSPNLEFFAFDIVVNGSENSDFINMYQAKSIAEEAGFNFIPFILEGTLEECLAFNNDFITTIPAILGLPEIDENICEGVVVKTVDFHRLGNGSRAVLKNKNERFAEVQKSPKTSPSIKDLTPELEQASNLIQDYINLNRLDAVFSKLGIEHENLERGLFGKVISILSKDALDDFKKDNERLVSSMTKEDVKVLNKLAVTFSRKLVISKV